MQKKIKSLVCNYLRRRVFDGSFCFHEERSKERKRKEQKKRNFNCVFNK